MPLIRCECFCELEISYCPVIMDGVKGKGDRDWSVGKWSVVGSVAGHAECVHGSYHIGSVQTDCESVRRDWN